MFGFAISIATIGIIIMAIDNTKNNTVIGFVFGITSSIGFCSFFNNFKMEKRYPKIYDCCYSWFILFYFQELIVFNEGLNFLSTSYNQCNVFFTHALCLSWFNFIFNWIQSNRSCRTDFIIFN